MIIKVWRISDLTADPENARTHDKKNLDAIASSLEKFGQRKPIVVMPTGVILAGNGTWAAAKQLGWSEIMVSVTPADWDYATAKAYALADNRTAELADWDTDILASQLIELDSVGWEAKDLGFDADLTPPTDPEPMPPREPKTHACQACGEVISCER
jgi:ParB-like chromosome segregation protein Spo0J